MKYTPEQLNYFRICYTTFNLVVEFPLHDNSVWGMERHSTKWTRFLLQRNRKKPRKGCSIFNDDSKGKYGSGTAVVYFLRYYSQIVLSPLWVRQSEKRSTISDSSKRHRSQKRGWTYWCWIPELCSKSDSCIYIFESLNCWSRGC